MSKVSLVRWSIFLLLGLPFQAVVYALYPLAWLYWRAFVFRSVEKSVPEHWEPDFEVGRATRLGGALLDNDDDHGALTHYGFVGEAGMRALVGPEGDFARRAEDDGSLNMNGVSGDCVAVWAFAYVQMPEDQRPRDLAVKAAWNYLKHLGTRSVDGWVSNRCNNFGINYCPDSDVLGLGQPAAGPQFYTTSSILAIASRESLALRLIFWAHWVVMGGWYWALWPALYPKDGLWYIRDVTMKMLWVHREVFGPRWWITMPMRRVNETTASKNALFEAMLGNDPGPMPSVMHAFFSQEKHAASDRKQYANNHRASAYIPDAIRKIREKARN